MDSEQTQTVFANQPKLFGKWDYANLKIEDPCFKDYISCTSIKSQVFVPHTAGRYQLKKFRKVSCPIVERFIGCLMYHGRNTGKKVKAIRILKHCFEIIHLMTGENPIQVLINGVVNGGPREDSTRIGRGGVVRKQAVDVSPMRRVSVGLFNMALGARKAAFKNTKSIAECLADEIMNAAKLSNNSFAVKKKDEVEKNAKANR